MDYDSYELSGFYELIFFMTFIQIFIAPLINRLYIVSLIGYFCLREHSSAAELKPLSSLS
jgi:hypothetical protein